MLVCLKDLREKVTSADAIESESIFDKGNNEYQVKLSRYQLPARYELSVYWGNPINYARRILEADERSRVAFISTTSGPGDLASWTEDPDDTPLEAADAICTAEAHAAGLAGDYRAYLNMPGQVDAACRLQGADALIANDCAPAPTDPEILSAPFLNMKGLPVAYGVDDIKQGLWRLPVGYNVNGMVSGSNAHAWTGGQHVGGTHHCNQWTSAIQSDSGRATSLPGERILNDEFALTCDGVSRLLCFSAQSQPWALSLEHQHNGKLVYVQKATPNISLAEADQACTQSKPAKIAEVVAWFSDSNNDAICRLLNKSGKISNNCNDTDIDWTQGPWVRADGYIVAETLQDLARSVLAPVLLDAEGIFHPPLHSEVVRTDTYSTGNGVSTPGRCLFGTRFSIERRWTYTAMARCADSLDYHTFVYCFEK